MAKFWKVGTPEDELSYYAAAPNRGTAIKLVEQFTGPINPARVRCEEMPMPPGYKVVGDPNCSVLEEDPDYEG